MDSSLKSQIMDSSKKSHNQVWTLNTTLWKWELETILGDKIEDKEFMQDLIILFIIVGIILVLIFLLSIQISRSYFGASSRTAASRSHNYKHRDFVINMDRIQREDPPSYDQVVR